ncbi:MAG: sulfatase-like hydrolase/transferase [Proteobacteria bacterium]|nr:sulfatase-like hydrolase/transferase [Pseudomonadota bacterium]
MKYKLACLLLVLILAACKANVEDTAESTDKQIKHLVLIAIDTVRADTFFAPDQHQYSDRLSPWLKKARIYQQAQSVSPWTIPAVSTVLTGYFPNQHGAGRFPAEIANLKLQTPTAIHAGVKTVAERMTEQGFRSRAASAHPWLSLKFGMQRGFKNIAQLKTREEIDNWFEQYVIDWAESNPDRRNFAYLHYMEAHNQHTSKKKKDYFSRLTPEQIQQGLDWNQLQACKKGVKDKVCRRYLIYTQAVLGLRDSIASTMEILEEQGYLDDTLVVVYSDHGEEFHDHRRQALKDNHDPRGIAGFGHGNSMYQELLHVPVLVWNPADKTGRLIENPVSLIDIAPSILNWLNIDIDAGILPGMLLDNAEKHAERALYASNMAYGPEQIAVRDGNSKSIWNTVNDESRYFDLAIDPLEKNLIQSDELVLHFDQLTGDYINLASTSIGLAPEINKEQLQHLKAIGYLQGNDNDTGKIKPAEANSEIINFSDISGSDSDDYTEAPDDEN